MDSPICSVVVVFVALEPERLPRSRSSRCETEGALSGESVSSSERKSRLRRSRQPLERTALFEAFGQARRPERTGMPRVEMPRRRVVKQCPSHGHRLRIPHRSTRALTCTLASSRGASAFKSTPPSVRPSSLLSPPPPPILVVHLRVFLFLFYFISPPFPSSLPPHLHPAAP